jgi:cadmium resistance protein CadD (predicted permease)
LLSSVGLAIVLFVTTNIDDIFLLLAFFADPKFRARQVVVGQYLGLAALVAVSILASLISLVLAPAYVGLLGLLPILLGLRQLMDAWRGSDDDDDNVPTASLGNVLTVAAVTVANGGDNIGVYTPVFATATPGEILTISAVFTIMAAGWCAFAHWLVQHPALGPPIRRFAHITAPFVLIGIGLFVLYEAGSWSLLPL